MKPPFALALSDADLTLLFRVADGWAELGRVGYDAPDLDARIADLRARAEGLAPGAVTTKIILPESQILYTEVAAPGPDAASRRAQIAAALEGMTPYAVDELAYDWSRPNGSGSGTVHVAVVARVTLAEAEAFAEAQGLNPVSFVALPPAGQFGGEPFFGLASDAASRLPEGARLDRDQDPVRIVALPAALAEASAPAPGASAGPVEIEPGSEAEAPSCASDLSESNNRRVEEPSTDREATAPRRTAGSPGETTGPRVPEAPFIALDDTGAEDTAAEDAGADVGTGRDAGRAEGAIAFASRRAPAGPATDGRGAVSAIPAAPLAEATGRLHLLADAPDVAVARGAPRLGPATLGPEADTPGITAPGIDLPQSVLDAREGSANSRQRSRGFGRAALTDLPETRHGTQAQLRERQAAASSLTPGTAGVFGAEPRATRRTAADRRRLGLILTAALVLLMAAVALWSLWFGTDDKAPGTVTPAPTETSSATPPPAASPEAPAADTPTHSAAASPDEDPAPASGAASDTASATAGLDVAPAPEAAAPASDPVTEALEEALAPADAGSAAPGPAAERPEAVAPPDVETPAPAEPLQPPPPVWTGIADGAGAAVAEQASGAAALAAAADPGRADLPAEPQGLDAPVPAATADSRPPVQPLPPPFGTVIRFDPDGRIRATPEGVITPEGFTLYAGRPPVVPATAPRPDATPAGTAAVAAPETLPPLPPPADPSHAARKPAARPAAVLERAASEAATPVPVAPSPAVPPDAVPPDPSSPSTTEGALPPPVDPAHAARAPKLRPATIVARAEAARVQAAAVAAAAEAAARAEAEALAGASRLAVASSRRPSERPSGLAKAVEAAVAAAVAAAATPEPAPAAVPATAPAPEAVEIDEPEPVESMPNIPTTVTVSKQATVKNAIDLGEINLIGVFGSSASRRALVRMPNGRLVKLKVGDRLDGGQVAAIGDSELTYVKGGRSVTLKIQKSG